jgi:hypothetical protein
MLKPRVNWIQYLQFGVPILEYGIRCNVQDCAQTQNQTRSYQHEHIKTRNVLSKLKFLSYGRMQLILLYQKISRVLIAKLDNLADKV